MNLRELGEFGLIDRIAARTGTGSGVRLGIGDDAAILTPTPGQSTLITKDMLVEGIHFDLALTDGYALGRKSLAVNLSDIAAMGGVPRQALLGLAIPPAMPVEFLDRFIEGLLAMAAAHDVTLIGGDTCSSAAGLTISVTLLGEQSPELILRRDGARPGDLIFVTGTLGDSARGLELLRQGMRTGPLIERHLDPTPRVREGAGLAAAGLATAMIDISDGLLADLGHILRLSGVGARLDLAHLPLSGPFRASLPAGTADPFPLPLSGGEDYELLFTASPPARGAINELMTFCGTPVTVVGTITAGDGLIVCAPDGSPYTPGPRGYDHFR